MKKIFSWVLLYICISATACAQKINVPPAVTKTFNSKFVGAKDIKWGKESAKEYEAEFKLNGTNVSANFGMDGSWVETETVIKIADLPAPVTAAVTRKYPGSTITMAEKLEMPGGKVLYEATFKVKGKKKSIELNPDGSIAK